MSALHRCMFIYICVCVYLMYALFILDRDRHLLLSHEGVCMKRVRLLISEWQIALEMLEAMSA